MNVCRSRLRPELLGRLDRQKPHIVISNKGNPHKIWCCAGRGDVACDNSPELAYNKWLRRTTTQ